MNLEALRPWPGILLGLGITWGVVFGLYHLHNYSPALASLGVAVIWVWYTRRLNARRRLGPPPPGGWRPRW